LPLTSRTRALFGNSDRGADRNRVVEVYGHEFRHPNAAMRRGITWKITGVHPYPVNDAHKVRHWRAFEMRPGRLWIYLFVDIRDDDVIVRVHIIAVAARDVV